MQPQSDLSINDDKDVKILIRYKSPVLEEVVVETLWAEAIDEFKGLYRINNIPIYGPLLASDDIVFAEYDPGEGMLTYRETIEPSGNSIVLVVLMDDTTDVEVIRNEFKSLGCESEGTGKRYFTMEIPFDLDYKPIRQVLKAYSLNGVLEYSEPCLSEKHTQ